mmetsp:Transcript_68106/g.127186  ORF Transcript_68106/g.127186 Transcript_68106/m.127186 type:complete len:473 (-) Transcript_68106:154-1572(-)
MTALMKQKSFRRRISLDLESIDSSPNSPFRSLDAERQTPSVSNLGSKPGIRRPLPLKRSSRNSLAEVSVVSEPLPALRSDSIPQLPAPPSTAPGPRHHRKHHHHRLHSFPLVRPTMQDVGAARRGVCRLPSLVDVESEMVKDTPTGARPRAKTWAADPTIAQATPSTASASSISGDSSCSCTPTSELSAAIGRPLPRIQGLQWRRGEKIGSGSYGSVYKALCKDSGLIFAVKQAVIHDENEEDRKFREQLAKEIDICKDLRHQNIVSYLGHDYHDSRLYIYLEYAPGGSLASVYKEFGPVEGALLPSTSNGLVAGLNYLHTRATPIVHRDIKCANVLVDLNMCVKLADFGCSKRNTLTTSFTTMGSIPWMAPEVIQQENGYGRKADIWSLGCTVLEMATAEKPWGDRAFDNVMFAMRHIGMSDALPPVPEDLPTVAKSFLACCLQRNPAERPWTEELLQSAFLRSRRCGSPP